ncbi:MAG: IS1634 family transposase [Actinomycetota bacterium]|nr:IS1634 family transposase [Actinomycetota bacterium]
MSDIGEMLAEMNITHAEHLPVVATFMERMGIVDTINAAAPTEMVVDSGTVVKLMVLDTLSGRSPLYRLETFAESIDTGLLLGRETPSTAFNDTTLGRAMDAVYEAGTEKLFSQIALRAAMAYPLEVNTLHVHFDTTSVNVWGDYRMCEEGCDGLKITHGHSKDKRPDLKQFLLKMLCIHRNIPIIGGTESGNASDKKINNEVLTNLSRHMARHGLAEGAFVYIADSAFVTPKNLEALGENLFITRLPFTYKQTDRIIAEAVRKDEWIAVKSEVASSDKRKRASYRVCEGAVELYGQSYRAIVVHSDAHDKRRQKKLDRITSESREAYEKILSQAKAVEYFCREDAEAAAASLMLDGSPCHYCSCTVVEKETYARGRPPKNGERRVAKVRYVLEGGVVENKDEIKRIREAAGCFVLLSNVPASGDMAHSPKDVLTAYKEQHGIERNFGFLKDPLIVNDIFLKRPDRIEVLGFILLVSLLTWNLMEHVMREYLKSTNSTIPGWDKKPTKKPTSFMMTVKFKGVLVARVADKWCFTAPLTYEQRQYIQAMGLTEESLLRKGNM